MAAAINEALADALLSDDDVFLLGEDIIDPAGGSMKVTAGLSTRFGTHRVRETPISEQAIVGAAIGAALNGMRPVAEIMFADFLAVCLDQVVNHAAKIRYMSAGRVTVPLTIRCMAAGGLQLGSQHSQMPEVWLTNSPGLKVCVPSGPADAKGLMTSCIRDDDPCVMIEMASLYFGSAPVPAGEHVVPLGVANTVRPGNDVTIITYGRQVHDSLAAAKQVAGEIDVEVIDLRTLVPLDEQAILNSVARTRRCVIVHQAVERSGFGAELSALINEHLFGQLEAPVLRVAGRNTPVPYAAELEQAHLPSIARIVDAVRAVAK